MMTQTDVLDQFRHAIEAAGLTPPEEVVPDGSFHRFPTNGKRDDDAGYYVFHSDGIPAGLFGCFRSDVKQTWCGKSAGYLTKQERDAHRARIKAMQRQRDAEEHQRHVEAAKQAAAIWTRAQSAHPSHPYLKKKCIAPHGLRVDSQNRLIVPISIQNALASLQFIAPDGDKKFLTGGAVKGGSFTIGDPATANILAVCEGVATGATIHAATGYPVVLALSAPNLMAVAKQVRQQHPRATILLCGDDDIRNDGVPNTGREAATAAANAIGGVLAMPTLDGQKCDFNDVARASGIDTVRELIEAALRSNIREEGPSNGTDEQENLFHHTDLGNARRLVARHGAAFRYCFKAGFFVWDGRRFALDESGAMMRLATETVCAVYREASERTEEQARKALVDHAKKSEAAPRLQAMIELAKSDVSVVVTLDQFDADPWALNCANGVLDLRTKTLRAPRRDDLLTKHVPVAYDPTAEAPGWDRFLAQITDGDQALMAFLQKAVGYTLTGDVREQVLFLPYGGGSNGKSVFLGILLALLGDYGKSTRTETLLAKKYDGIPNDVARLHGARLVSAVESEAGRRLAEALVKQLTGGDTVCARFLRREFFEFRPSFKVWLAVNHKPTVRGTDHAIWRRLRPLPFLVTIPDHKQDKTLTDKLKGELPGILAWAVEGTSLWLQDGLVPPEAVIQATQTYREEMDVLGAFLRECCIIDPDAKETAADLYCSYKEPWCKESGEKPITKTAFGIALRERGFAAKVHRGAQHWFGVRLRTALDPVSDDDLAQHADAPREEVNIDAD